VFDKIIIIILGLSTVYSILRGFIASTGIVPKDCKFAYLVYGDSTNLNKILSDIGFPIKQTRNKISKLSLPNDAKISDKILCICINSIYKPKHQIDFGSETPVRTSYYINTMATVHNNEDLETMAMGILELCNKHFHRVPDFLITPKRGNPILAYEIAKIQPTIHTILIKDTKDSSFARGHEEDVLCINYEGLNHLLEEIENSKDNKYYGIAVDCNVSDGRTLQRGIDNFNKTVGELYKENIEKISDAFVLFKADDAHDIDIAYGDKKIHRYFDLTEEVKEEMYKIQNSKKTRILYNEKTSIKEINRLKSIMQDKELIKEDI
jgi:hypothetical protein